MIMCDEDLVEDSEAQIINPHHEALPNLKTQEKTVLTLTASKKSAVVMDRDNPCLSKQNEADDSEVESWKIEMDKNRTSTAIDKDDTDVIEGPICSDGIAKDPNSLASLDDPVEYPRLGALNQSKVLDRPARKLKRTTSISTSHRANKKKMNSQISPPQSTEV